MSVFVCDRCDHYRDNDMIEAHETDDGLVCEYCVEEYEIPEIADVEAWQEEYFV